MDAETWMDANAALNLGFADEILQRADDALPFKKEEDDEETDEQNETNEDEKKKEKTENSMLFSRKAVSASLTNKLRHRLIAEAAKTKPTVNTPKGRSVDELKARLNTIKEYI